jgi:integrase
MGLTKRIIDQAKYDPSGKKSQILWDGDVPGFGLRLFPSGAKTFTLDYRTENGRSRRLTLGRYGVLTPDQARKRAREELARVGQGADPVEERRSKREAVTVRQFADVYIERHAKPHKRTWQEDRRRLDVNILPAIGGRALSGITRADVAALHAKIGKRAPMEANSHFVLLSCMRSRAIEWGFLPEDAPSWRVKKFPGRSRESWVRPEYLPALLEAFDAEPSPFVRCALHLALLTGMRRGEILNLRWQDVDLNRGEITLQTTKAKRTHSVPLVPEAVALLRGLPRQLGNPHVICSETRPGTHLHDLKGPWDRVRGRMYLAMHPEAAPRLQRQAEADVAKRSKHAAARQGHEPLRDRLLALAAREAADKGEALRLHDVRRTTGSLLALSGASLQVIGRVLNHSNPSTTAIYTRLTEDAPRNALGKLADALRVARGGA